MFVSPLFRGRITAKSGRRPSKAFARVRIRESLRRNFDTAVPEGLGELVVERRSHALLRADVASNAAEGLHYRGRSRGHAARGDELLHEARATSESIEGLLHRVIRVRACRKERDVAVDERAQRV